MSVITSSKYIPSKCTNHIHTDNILICTNKDCIEYYNKPFCKVCSLGFIEDSKHVLEHFDYLKDYSDIDTYTDNKSINFEDKLHHEYPELETLNKVTKSTLLKVHDKINMYFNRILDKENLILYETELNLLIAYDNKLNTMNNEFDSLQLRMKKITKREGEKLDINAKKAIQTRIKDLIAESEKLNSNITDSTSLVKSLNEVLNTKTGKLRKYKIGEFINPVFSYLLKYTVCEFDNKQDTWKTKDITKEENFKKDTKFQIVKSESVVSACFTIQVKIKNIDNQASGNIYIGLISKKNV